jgi:hypothetical protein
MRYIFIWFIFVICFATLSSAGSIGISPASFSEYFEPHFEKTYSFKALNADSVDSIEVSLGGGLAEFANLSKIKITNGESFQVTLKLPFALSRPGNHPLYVTLTENYTGDGGSTVSGRVRIQAVINIFVPYPGKYIESTFEIFNINEHENASYELSIDNLGTEPVSVDPKIVIYEDSFSEKVRLDKILETVSIETKSSTKIEGTLDTSLFPAGTYNVTTTLYHYGNITEFERILLVGQRALEIKDYDHQFIQGKINPFNILVQSKWNSEMTPVYARVTITDNGAVVGEFRTVSNSLEPWGAKSLMGFFDAENLESKRYLANIFVHYEDLSINKLVAIYVNDPPMSFDYRPIIISSLSVFGIFLVIILVLLIKRVNQLKSRLRGAKNEKGK